MLYVPIIIPTLCRFEHFRDCVESLKCCQEARQTELYVGLDYPAKEEHVQGWELIGKYLKNLSGFKQINVIRHTFNHGCFDNSATLKQSVLQQYDYFACTEDDNVFSPAFLNYINWGIEKFMDNKDVYAICGYTHNPPTNETRNYGYFRSKRFSAWGYAIWRDRLEMRLITMENRDKMFESIFNALKILRTDTEIYYMLRNSYYNKQVWGDVLIDCSMMLYHELKVIQPTVTLVRNLGHDGSGIHCGIVNNMQEKERLREVDVRYTFDGTLELPKELLYNYLKDKSTYIGKWKQALKEYIRFYIKHKLSKIKHKIFI